VLGGVLTVAIAVGMLIRERWTTPAAEMKTVLGFYTTLAAGQQTHFGTYRSYTDLQQLLGTGSGKYRVHAKCQDSFCFEVSGNGSNYSIRIFPDRRTPSPRHLSLYSDEKQVVRVAYGFPEAHAESTVLSREEMRRFRPE
jgi:hypothetical protein